MGQLLTPGIGLVIWMMIAFIVVLIILRKYAWKPILGAIKQRELSIEESLNQAEMAREEMKKLQADNEKLIQEARQEREKILKDALGVAENIKEQAKKEALKISDKMVQDAKTAIEAEKQAALADVKRQVAQLSLEIAEKLLRKNLSDDKAQKALVNEYIKDLNQN